MWPWLSAVADVLARFNLVDVLFCGVFFVFWLWILKRNFTRADTYDLADNIKDPFTNRAAPGPLVYLSLALLAIWWAVRDAVSGADPSAFIKDVLMIFVVKAGADHAISAWGTRQPDKLIAPPDPGSAPQVVEAAVCDPDKRDDRKEEREHGS
jgi:hypothetical protein